MEIPSSWLYALAGGALIGLAALTMMLFLGRIAGISGIFFAALTGEKNDRGWRLAFLAGLLLGGLALTLFAPGAFPAPAQNWPGLLIAGLLVGFGTVLGTGCTSGHGVCGVSRLSPRSLVATATFMVAGMLSVALLKKAGLL